LGSVRVKQRRLPKNDQKGFKLCGFGNLPFSKKILKNQHKLKLKNYIKIKLKASAICPLSCIDNLYDPNGIMPKNKRQ